MTVNREILKALGNAKIFEKSGKIERCGKYKWLVGKMVYEQKRKGVRFILELTVLESKATDPSEAPHLPGTRQAYIQAMELEGADGRVKECVIALAQSLGMETIQEDMKKDPDLFANVMGDMLEGACAGMIIEGEVYFGESKKKERQRWVRFDAVSSSENTVELLAARRAKK